MPSFIATALVSFVLAAVANGAAVSSSIVGTANATTSTIFATPTAITSTVNASGVVSTAYPIPTTNGSTYDCFCQIPIGGVVSTAYPQPTGTSNVTTSTFISVSSVTFATTVTTRAPIFSTATPVAVSSAIFSSAAPVAVSSAVFSSGIASSFVEATGVASSFSGVATTTFSNFPSAVTSSVVATPVTSTFATFTTTYAGANCVCRFPDSFPSSSGTITTSFFPEATLSAAFDNIAAAIAI